MAKTSRAGRPYLRFSCRVGDGDGAQWVSVTAFDENATGQADKFVKGARCYIEGCIKLEQWAGQDGGVRHGLGCLSWHCRLAEIGRNKPRRPRARKPVASGSAAAAIPELNGSIPFAPEWRG
jgi:Single-strand binding protein family